MISVGDIVKCLVLSDQQSKTQRSSVYHHGKQEKAANTHSLEPGTVKHLVFLLEKWFERLMDSQTSCGKMLNQVQRFCWETLRFVKLG